MIRGGFEAGSTPGVVNDMETPQCQLDITHDRRVTFSSSQGTFMVVVTPAPPGFPAIDKSPTLRRCLHGSTHSLEEWEILSSRIA